MSIGPFMHQKHNVIHCSTIGGSGSSVGGRTGRGSTTSVSSPDTAGTPKDGPTSVSTIYSSHL